MAEISTEEGKKLSGRIDRGRNSTIYMENSVIAGYGEDLATVVDPVNTTQVRVSPGLGVAGKSELNNGANCLFEVTQNENVTVTADGVFNVVYRVDLGADTATLMLTDTIEDDDLLNNLTGKNDLVLAEITVTGGVVTGLIDKRNLVKNVGSSAVTSERKEDIASIEANTKGGYVEIDISTLDLKKYLYLIVESSSGSSGLIPVPVGTGRSPYSVSECDFDGSTTFVDIVSGQVTPTTFGGQGYTNASGSGTKIVHLRGIKKD